MTAISNSTDKVSCTTDIRARISVDRSSHHNPGVSPSFPNASNKYSVVIPNIPRHGIPLSMLSRSDAERAPGCVGDNLDGRHLGSPAVTIQQPVKSAPLPVFLGSTTPSGPPPLQMPHVTRIVQHPVAIPQPVHQMLMQPYAQNPYQMPEQVPVQPIAVPGAMQMQYMPQQIHHHHHAPQMQQAPPIVHAPPPHEQYVPMPMPVQQLQNRVYPSISGGKMAPPCANCSAGGESTLDAMGPPGYRTLGRKMSETFSDSTAMMRDDRLKRHGFGTAAGESELYPSVYDEAPLGHRPNITYTSDNVSSVMIS